MMATFLASFSLGVRKEKATALLLPAHCLHLEGEVFSTVEGGSGPPSGLCFHQGVCSGSGIISKATGVMLLDCSRHHTERNTTKLTEDERVRNHAKVAFNNCKCRLRLKKTKEETWRLVITNSEHNHPIDLVERIFKMFLRFGWVSLVSSVALKVH